MDKKDTENMVVARDSLASFEWVIKSALSKANQQWKLHDKLYHKTEWPSHWLLGDGASYSIEGDHWPVVWLMLEGPLRSEEPEKILDKFNFPFIEMYSLVRLFIYLFI